MRCQTGYFDNDEDRRAYAEVISDYFAENGDETDAGMECEDNDGMVSLLRLQFDNANCSKRMNSTAGEIGWMLLVLHLESQLKIVRWTTVK